MLWIGLEGPPCPARTPRGALGGKATTETAAEAADQGPGPTALTAETRKRYVDPSCTCGSELPVRQGALHD